MSQSKIEWTDRSDWNPIRGCTRVSEGCRNCYAETLAGRFSDPGQWGHSFAERLLAGGRWTGKVEVQWARLDQPLRWRKPAKIFASSTSDWFHEALPVDEIANLFAIAVAAVHVRGHTFQILTKRAARMREVLTSEAFWDQVNAEAGWHVREYVDPLARRSDDARATLDDYDAENPPPGIWLGVSAEDQQRADERIPDLLATPAAVRFVSCEPMLGLINLSRVFDHTNEHSIDAPGGRSFFDPRDQDGEPSPRLDWVICGGESGRNARPMHPQWARDLRDQCGWAGVPFFFKQWGEWLPEKGWYEDHPVSLPLRVWNGSAWTDNPEINGEWMARLGKAHAGRLLDGVEHNGMPEATR
ncbi:phage Gp37/Gp68 family protein [Rhodoplanes roseus]|uniref:Phage Gp37/Gp68 family protein n=1 Tax=Rhodoplanes roseus TaxID=29409 RepID=A0A327KWX8_9BRAD|nr:phage Gp37/Gp68 family protein [Rhodoplanes roseus]RAI42811.1 hypothetical protein CH341_17615 [Rhodoplanes roseus]